MIEVEPLKRGRPRPSLSAVSIEGMGPGQRLLWDREPIADDTPALTLKHPWAFAVCHLGKRIENRGWRPPRGMIGRRFFVHAGVAPRGEELRDAVSLLQDLIATHAGEEYHQLTRRYIETAGDFTVRDALRPGIVAVATLDGVVESSRDPWFLGPFGWVLRDVIVLPEPVPCRGALGLWKSPADVIAEVRAWLA